MRYGGCGVLCATQGTNALSCLNTPLGKQFDPGILLRLIEGCYADLNALRALATRHD